MTPLNNAPPRLSDLPLPERYQAMVRRDENRRADWLRDRERRGFLQRLLDRVLG